MYLFLAEKIIYPLSDISLGTSVMKYYHWLQKTQWWSPEQLQELQNVKLRALVKHAFENVPYYQSIFKERGLTYKDIQTIEDLHKLPILTKSDIRQSFKDILAKDFKRWKPILNSSGGSTGEPLKYYITKDLASISWAGKFRGYSWAGYRIGDKHLKFGGSSLVPEEAPSIVKALRNKLERNLNVSALSMNKAKYDEFIKIIRKYKPDFLNSYASSIYHFSEYCKNNNIDDIGFKAIFSTAEVLLPRFRTAVESQFQCKVFDQYGAYDGGGQALECHEHQGFHISVEKAIMEIVNERGKSLPAGKSGSIIVTDLHNYAMPFLRYEVGDIGMLANEPCTCGRSLPLLKALEGRTTDIIRLSNGITITGVLITSIFAELPVKQFQVVQETKDKLLVKIVKDDAYSDIDTGYITRVLSHHAGKEIDIQLEFCDKIPVGKNSKYRYVISQIPV